MGNLRMHMGWEALAFGDRHFGPKPEFRVVPAFSGIDMHRLTRIAFVGEEVEAAAIPVEDFEHGSVPE